MKPPSYIIAKYLESLGVGTVGTDIFIGKEPESTGTIATIYDTGGRDPLHNLCADPDPNTWRPSIQLRVRSDSYPTAFARIGLLRRSILMLTGYSITEVVAGVQTTDSILDAIARSDIISIGEDANNRPVLTANFDLLADSHEANEEPSCQSCLGAWTGDIASSVGGTALDVAGLCGHTISTPAGSSSGLYLASSPVVSPVSPTWPSSELRVFENEFIQLADTTGKTSSLSFGIVKADFSASIFVWAEYDGTSTKIKVVGIPFNAASPIELPALQKAGTPDRVAVGVAGNGDIFILHGSLYAKSVSPWSGNFLPFQSMRSDLQGAWTGTAQTEVHMDSSEMTIVYPDMSADGITVVKDFCGNVVS